METIDERTERETLEIFDNINRSLAMDELHERINGILEYKNCQKYEKFDTPGWYNGDFRYFITHWRQKFEDGSSHIYFYVIRYKWKDGYHWDDDKQKWMYDEEIDIIDTAKSRQKIWRLLRQEPDLSKKKCL